MSWRRSLEYRRWRVAVIRRDSKCVICGSLQNRHAHHINHSQFFPLLRFEVSNGVCMCNECHSQFHNNFKKNTKMKCDYVDWNNFKNLVQYIKDLNTN